MLTASRCLNSGYSRSLKSIHPVGVRSRSRSSRKRVPVNSSLNHKNQRTRGRWVSAAKRHKADSRYEPRLVLPQFPWGRVCPGRTPQERSFTSTQFSRETLLRSRDSPTPSSALVLTRTSCLSTARVSPERQLVHHHRPVPHSIVMHIRNRRSRHYLFLQNSEKSENPKRKRKGKFFHNLS